MRLCIVVRRLRRTIGSFGHHSPVDWSRIGFSPIVSTKIAYNAGTKSNVKVVAISRPKIIGQAVPAQSGHPESAILHTVGYDA